MPTMGPIRLDGEDQERSGWKIQKNQLRETPFFEAQLSLLS
jgi:hypothetical protein